MAEGCGGPELRLYVQIAHHWKQFCGKNQVSNIICQFENRMVRNNVQRARWKDNFAVEFAGKSIKVSQTY